MNVDKVHRVKVCCKWFEHGLLCWLTLNCRKCDITNFYPTQTAVQDSSSNRNCATCKFICAQVKEDVLIVAIKRRGLTFTCFTNLCSVISKCKNVHIFLFHPFTPLYIFINGFTIDTYSRHPKLKFNFIHQASQDSLSGFPAFLSHCLANPRDSALRCHCRNSSVTLTASGGCRNDPAISVIS